MKLIKLILYPNFNKMILAVICVMLLTLIGQSSFSILFLIKFVIIAFKLALQILKNTS